MARSYRKPFYYICGSQTVKHDRTLAARGVRRSQNNWTRAVLNGGVDFEETPIPHRYECAWNNRYSWGCDGGTRLTEPGTDWYVRIQRK